MSKLSDLLSPERLRGMCRQGTEILADIRAGHPRIAPEQTDQVDRWLGDLHRAADEIAEAVKVAGGARRVEDTLEDLYNSFNRATPEGDAVVDALDVIRDAFAAECYPENEEDAA